MKAVGRLETLSDELFPAEQARIVRLLVVGALTRQTVGGWRAVATRRSGTAAERIDRGYLGRVLQLTLLAPDVVEAILDGRQQADLGLPALVGPFPLEWDAQRTALAKSG